MLLGLSYAVGACIVWGLIFAIPLKLNDFSTLEVASGRYITYALFSCLLLFRKGFAPLKVYTARIWMVALVLALLANPIYYVCTITGMRLASAALAVIILGMVPVTIVIYGNWHVKEISIKQLVVPFIAMFIGFVCVNGSQVDWSFQEHTIAEYLTGLFCIGIALVTWTVYVVHNARFLKRNPQIPTDEWATLIGVAALFWLVVLGLIAQYGFNLIDYGTLFNKATPHIMGYWIGAVILGVFSSWVGCLLWNKASSLLPVSMMGPLMIFETIFALIYVYIVEKTLPSILEIVGVLLLIGGVALSIQIFRKSQFKHN